MSYLEEYLKKVETFPQDVTLFLQNIKNLDIKVSQNQLELDKLQEQYLREFRNLKQKKQDTKKLNPLKKDIERIQKNCVMLSQQKMQVSDQLYQKIDDSIKELENDLKVFEEEMKQHNQNGMTPQEFLQQQQLNNPYLSTSKKDSFAQRKKKKYDSKMLSKINQENKRSDKLLQSAIEKEKEIISEWEINPHEPTYCYCNKASYGEMIKCDNLYCEKEWFHYDCVGLTRTPTGKWLCKNCKQKNQNNGH